MKGGEVVEEREGAPDQEKRMIWKIGKGKTLAWKMREGKKREGRKQ